MTPLFGVQSLHAFYKTEGKIVTMHVILCVFVRAHECLDVYREQILHTKRQVGKLKGSQIVTIGGRFHNGARR
jgi:hypothetical protein